MHVISKNIRSFIDTYNNNYDYFYDQLTDNPVMVKEVCSALSELNKNFEKNVELIVDEFYEET